MTNSAEEAFANQQSWQGMVSFYEDIVTHYEHHQDKKILLRLTEALSNSEKSRLFRAGQSLFTLMISTTPYHGLKSDDHFVAVDLDCGQGENPSLTVEYFRSSRDCAYRHTCTEETVRPVLDQALERLWRETRGAGAS